MIERRLSVKELNIFFLVWFSFGRFIKFVRLVLFNSRARLPITLGGVGLRGTNHCDGKCIIARSRGWERKQL